MFRGLSSARRAHRAQSQLGPETAKKKNALRAGQPMPTEGLDEITADVAGRECNGISDSEPSISDDEASANESEKAMAVLFRSMLCYAKADTQRKALNFYACLKELRDHEANIASLKKGKYFSGLYLEKLLQEPRRRYTDAYASFIEKHSDLDSCIRKGDLKLWVETVGYPTSPEPFERNVDG